MSSFPLPLEGGCRCGAVRYQITQPPAFLFACHCTDCRQLSASAFSLGMPVAEAGFEIAAGAPAVWTKTGDSGKPSHQYGCPVCHGWTHTRALGSPGFVVVRPTTLDRSDWVRPIAQIFLRSSLPWARLQTPLDYQTEFEDFEPLKAAFAASDIRPPAAA